MAALFRGLLETSYNGFYVRFFGDGRISGGRHSYEAMMSGTTAVVSGLKNKIENQLGDLMPDTVRTKISKKKHEPVEPKQKKSA